MMKIAIVLLLEIVVLASAKLSYDDAQQPANVELERLFHHAEGIKLAPDTISNDKFMERKVVPIETWTPPSRIVEDLYFQGRAEHQFHDYLAKFNGYSDTDIIMMNRWHGQEEKENLWEADMILTPKQKKMYSKKGKVYGNRARLFPDFSLPWKEGRVEYFFENEGPAQLFGNLETAMMIWERAVPCIKFHLAEGMANFSHVNASAFSIKPEITTEGYEVPKIPPTSSNKTDPAKTKAAELARTRHLLRITVSEGCFSTVGRRDWSRLVISPRCSLGVLVHLLGHVLGLPHEHSRPDRALRLDLHPPSVRTRDFLFLNLESGGARCDNDSEAGWYDVRSVMHFAPAGLSANNGSAVSARYFPETAQAGAAWPRPSHNDALRLRRPGAYACARAAPPGCEAAPACAGRWRADCACERPPECAGARAPGGCSADVALRPPGAGAEQLALPAASSGRSCAWLLRAGAACRRVRLALRMRMEEPVRVRAVALGCAPLRVEVFDFDPQAGGANVTTVVCLSDFTRWRPAGSLSWMAQKVIVSSSPELRVLIRTYPARDEALNTVIQSFEAHVETVLDKYCHCKLPGYPM